MKREISLIALLSASLVACDPGSQIVQRDVYHSLEECVADWGELELCERQQKQNEEKAKAVASAGNTAAAIIFFGPSYHGNDRYVAHNGQTYAPTSSRARSTASFAGAASRNPISFSNPRPAATSVSPTPSQSTRSAPVGSVSNGATVSRGGFGSAGASASASS